MEWPGKERLPFSPQKSCTLAKPPKYRLGGKSIRPAANCQLRRPQIGFRHHLATLVHANLPDIVLELRHRYFYLKLFDFWRDYETFSPKVLSWRKGLVLGHWYSHPSFGT